MCWVGPWPFSCRAFTHVSVAFCGVPWHSVAFCDCGIQKSHDLTCSALPHCLKNSAPTNCRTFRTSPVGALKIRASMAVAFPRWQAKVSMWVICSFLAQPGNPRLEYDKISSQTFSFFPHESWIQRLVQTNAHLGVSENVVLSSGMLSGGDKLINSDNSIRSRSLICFLRFGMTDRRKNKRPVIASLVAFALSGIPAVPLSNVTSAKHT